ncbi:MAG TPA: hypothetical protein VD790_07050 [Thermoleophilaceae bacterium]|nr:hypothetical protein [Thermoleophilaceae bacterium]
MTITKALSGALVAAVAMTSTASAKSVDYVGKTDSGHKVTFTLKNKRMHELRAGVRMSCIPIQGGGAPTGGSEIFGFRGKTRMKRHIEFSFMSKPAFHYNEVTMNHDVWTKRRPGGVIKGRMRLQYEFLIPKYPIGTFTIYSCLGGARFKTKRVG